MQKEVSDEKEKEVVGMDDKPINCDGYWYADVGIDKELHKRCAALAKTLSFSIDDLYCGIMSAGIRRLFEKMRDAIPKENES